MKKIVNLMKYISKLSFIRLRIHSNLLHCGESTFVGLTLVCSSDSRRSYSGQRFESCREIWIPTPNYPLIVK